MAHSPPEQAAADPAVVAAPDVADAWPLQAMIAQRWQGPRSLLGRAQTAPLAAPARREQWLAQLGGNALGGLSSRTPLALGLAHELASAPTLLAKLGTAARTLSIAELADLVQLVLEDDTDAEAEALSAAFTPEASARALRTPNAASSAKSAQAARSAQAAGSRQTDTVPRSGRRRPSSARPLAPAPTRQAAKGVRAALRALEQQQAQFVLTALAAAQQPGQGGAVLSLDGAASPSRAPDWAALTADSHPAATPGASADSRMSADARGGAPADVFGPTGRSPRPSRWWQLWTGAAAPADGGRLSVAASDRGRAVTGSAVRDAASLEPAAAGMSGPRSLAALHTSGLPGREWALRALQREAARAAQRAGDPAGRDAAGALQDAVWLALQEEADAALAGTAAGSAASAPSDYGAGLRAEALAPGVASRLAAQRAPVTSAPVGGAGGVSRPMRSDPAPAATLTSVLPAAGLGWMGEPARASWADSGARGWSAAGALGPVLAGFATERSERWLSGLAASVSGPALARSDAAPAAAGRWNAASRPTSVGPGGGAPADWDHVAIGWDNADEPADVLAAEAPQGRGAAQSAVARAAPGPVAGAVQTAAAARATQRFVGDWASRALDFAGGALPQAQFLQGQLAPVGTAPRTGLARGSSGQGLVAAGNRVAAHAGLGALASLPAYLPTLARTSPLWRRWAAGLAPQNGLVRTQDATANGLSATATRGRADALAVQDLAWVALQAADEAQAAGDQPADQLVATPAGTRAADRSTRTTSLGQQPPAALRAALQALGAAPAADTAAPGADFARAFLGQSWSASASRALQAAAAVGATRRAEWDLLGPAWDGVGDAATPSKAAVGIGASASKPMSVLDEGVVQLEGMAALMALQRPPAEWASLASVSSSAVEGDGGRGELLQGATESVEPVAGSTAADSAAGGSAASRSGNAGESAQRAGRPAGSWRKFNSLLGFVPTGLRASRALLGWSRRAEAWSPAAEASALRRGSPRGRASAFGADSGWGLDGVGALLELGDPASGGFFGESLPVPGQAAAAEALHSAVSARRGDLLLRGHAGAVAARTGRTAAQVGELPAAFASMPADFSAERALLQPGSAAAAMAQSAVQRGGATAAGQATQAAGMARVLSVTSQPAANTLPLVAPMAQAMVQVAAAKPLSESIVTSGADPTMGLPQTAGVRSAGERGRGDQGQAAPAEASAQDLDALAQKIARSVMVRLKRERERRGLYG